MTDLDKASCVVARHIDGTPALVDLEADVREVGSGITTAWFWALDRPPVLPDDIGAQPGGPYFPGPGGAKFGLLRIAGRSDVTMSSDQPLSAGITRNDSTTGMHETSSLDMEIVISGRMVLEIPGGQSRTLSPGDSVVLAGVAHRWYNPFDEPCVYAGVIFGADTVEKEAGNDHV